MAKEKMDYTKILTRQMGRREKVLIYVGVVVALIFGAALPAFCIVFGGLVDDLGSIPSSAKGFQNIEKSSFKMLYEGCAVMVLGAIQVATLTSFSELIAYKTRLAYYKSCLSQDATYYDMHNAAEMSSKIATEITAI
mmetsp:Transcript_6128/g.9830  ORF Transcript_6128/g.9830 Transcript_6128/m.9830 type:complete len:137 (-) Transcript_6128:3673-4083(-)